MLSILLSGIHYYPQRPLPHTSEHFCIQSVDPHITVHPHCLSSTPLVHRVHAHPPCNPCHLPPLPSLPLSWSLLWWLSLSSSFCPSSFQCPCAGLSLSDPARGPARVLIVCPIVSLLFSHSPSVKYSQRQLTLFIFVAGQLGSSLLQDGDLKTFRRRRESELKNGRVAMFATMGCYLPRRAWQGWTLRSWERMREDERGTCQVFWILLDSFGLVPDVFVCIFVELTDVFFHCFWNDGIDC